MYSLVDDATAQSLECMRLCVVLLVSFKGFGWNHELVTKHAVTGRSVLRVIDESSSTCSALFSIAPSVALSRLFAAELLFSDYSSSLCNESTVR